MSLRTKVYSISLILALSISIAAFSAQSKETLKWKDLRTVKNVKKPPAKIHKLNGQVVKIGGFMVPLDGDHNGVSEFLLVPFQGQCIHVPPPPPNQMIHVKMAKGKIKYTWEPILVKGKFSLIRLTNEFGDSFFAIDALRISEYE